MVMNRIVRAFDPIIQLMQGIAYPLAYIAISTGICLIIVGQKRGGMSMIKWAAVGYLLMQWLPSIMQILADVGQAMRP